MYTSVRILIEDTIFELWTNVENPTNTDYNRGSPIVLYCFVWFSLKIVSVIHEHILITNKRQQNTKKKNNRPP